MASVDLHNIEGDVVGDPRLPDGPQQDGVRGAHLLDAVGGHLLGEEGAGFKIAQERLGPGRIHHCMRWIGICNRAFDLMCARVLISELMVRGDVVPDEQQRPQPNPKAGLLKALTLDRLFQSLPVLLSSAGQAVPVTVPVSVLGEQDASIDQHDRLHGYADAVCHEPTPFLILSTNRPSDGARPGAPCLDPRSGAAARGVGSLH